MKTQGMLVVSLVTFLGCSDAGVDWIFPIPENASVSQANQLILGQWEWVKSLSNSTGPTLEYTPRLAGYTRQMEFLQNGVVNLYRNDSLTGTATFSIDSGTYSSSLTLVLDGNANYDFRVSDDYLGFDNRPVDGPAEFFVRRK